MSARLKSRSLLAAPTRFLLLGAILLSSCSVGPDYSRPPIATPAAYKESMGVKLQWLDDVIAAKWWEIFGDSELNNLEQQVDISNQNIAQAEARFRQARALVQSARAAYYPTVTVGIGVTGMPGTSSVSVISK